MRGTPCTRYSPPFTASAAVSGRIAVPALPRNRSAVFAVNAPRVPDTTHTSPSRFSFTPSFPSAAIITRVSSESSRFVIVVSPSASAASSNTRFEMLFEPGKRIVPDAREKGPRSR